MYTQVNLVIHNLANLSTSFPSYNPDVTLSLYSKKNPIGVHVCVLQSCLTLLPGSSVRGILQARILEWTARPSSRGSSQPRDRTPVSYVSYLDRQVLYH